MDLQQEAGDSSYRKTFFNHVFSTTEEGKAEILNVVQYSLLGIVPIVMLNKLIQRFIPEADDEMSSISILVEVMIQVIVMFCGIIIIHRVITYIPTYSGFKYENLILTNVILAFLVIVLSIQTKLGIKVNILVDRLNELWNGASSNEDKKSTVRNGVRVSQPMAQHMPSQADHLDNGYQQGAFPPAPQATSKQNTSGYDHMMGARNSGAMLDFGPAPANSLVGSIF